MAAAKPSENRPVEIRIRFEPGLGAALYASLHDGDVEPLRVARLLGRGRALLDFHGVTLLAQGAPEWKLGETFLVVVKELGPPLVLTPVGTGRENRARVITIDSAVVPGSARANGPGVRG